MTYAFTRYIDVAQVSLYVFWVFFAGLIFYIRREDKREGYPLLPEGVQKVTRGTMEGFPPVPPPKRFLLPLGGVSYAPPPPIVETIKAVPAGMFPGAPLIPTGNPLVDGVGPASWTERTDVTDKTFAGDNRMVPMRHKNDYAVSARSDDPRGWTVIGADGLVAGVVRDIWLDETESSVRYLEIALDASVAADRHHVLVPEVYVRYRPRHEKISVRAILAHQFADVPVLRNPDEVTLLEEDRLVAYYGGGSLYATPARLGPLL